MAVAGAGLMGRWHARLARRHGAEVVAVVDPEAGAAARLAREFPGATAFDDMAAMLASARPRVVHVCSPLPTHAPLANLALEAGAHALVEKPLAPTARETRALLDKARALGLQLCPVHQFAFQRGVERAARLLEDLGEALHAGFTICSAGGEGLADERLDALLADILPHPFSVLQALWPRHELRPGDWSARRPRRGELHASGKSGAIEVGVHFSLNARPTRCAMEISCTGGTVHLDFFHGFAVARRGDPSRVDKAVQPFRSAAGTLVAAAANLAHRAIRREAAYPGLDALVGRFLAAAQGRRACPISPKDALAAAEVRDAIVAQAFAEPAPA